MTIAENDARPRYQVIADELFADITSGRHPVGGMLPTEMELCARYNVSRYTGHPRGLPDPGFGLRTVGPGTVRTSPVP
jgi:GntR family transcriptional regulator